MLLVAFGVSSFVAFIMEFFIKAQAAMYVSIHVDDSVDEMFTSTIPHWLSTCFIACLSLSGSMYTHYTGYTLSMCIFVSLLRNVSI